MGIAKIINESSCLSEVNWSEADQLEINKCHRILTIIDALAKNNMNLHMCLIDSDSFENTQRIYYNNFYSENARLYERIH